MYNFVHEWSSKCCTLYYTCMFVKIQCAVHCYLVKSCLCLIKDLIECLGMFLQNIFCYICKMAIQ